MAPRLVTKDRTARSMGRAAGALLALGALVLVVDESEHLRRRPLADRLLSEQILEACRLDPRAAWRQRDVRQRRAAPLNAALDRQGAFEEMDRLEDVDHVIQPPKHLPTPSWWEVGTRATGTRRRGTSGPGRRAW